MLSMPRAFLLFVLLAVPALSVHAADKVTTVPVHFNRGSHSATVKGSFAGYDTVHYTLAARAGQSMTVKISGKRPVTTPCGGVSGCVGRSEIEVLST